MKKALLVLAAAMAACSGAGSSSTGANSAKGPISSGAALRALPAASQLLLGTPGLQSSAAGNGNALWASTCTANSKQIPTSGSVPYEMMAEGLALRMNAGIEHEIARLQAFLADPNVTCSADTCTLAATRGSVSWKVAVTKTTDATTQEVSYAYTVSGEPQGGSTYLTVLTGTVTPTATPGVGSGSFTVDFGNASALDRTCPERTGTLAVTYDNTSSILLSVDAESVLGPDAGKGTANLTLCYSGVSATDPTQGGDLELALGYTNSVVADSSKVHVRWDSTGEGRTDVVMNGTDPHCGPGSFDVTECWAKAPCYYLEYVSVTATGAKGTFSYLYPVGGEEDACVGFPTASPPVSTCGSGGSSADGGSTPDGGTDGGSTPR